MFAYGSHDIFTRPTPAQLYVMRYCQSLSLQVRCFKYFAHVPIHDSWVVWSWFWKLVSEGPSNLVELWWYLNYGDSLTHLNFRLVFSTSSAVVLLWSRLTCLSMLYLLENVFEQPSSVQPTAGDCSPLTMHCVHVALETSLQSKGSLWAASYRTFEASWMDTDDVFARWISSTMMISTVE
jgi:hypothetical protein